jgi:hypothetical protein
LEPSNTFRTSFIIIILLDLLFAYAIRFPWTEKYLAAIAYLLNLVLIPAACLGVFSLIYDDPFTKFPRGGVAVLVGLSVMMLYHTILVILAVSRHNLNILDRNMDTMGNFLGPTMLVCLSIGRIFESELPNLMWDSACIIVGMLYSFFLFQLPSVTHYWHKSKDATTKSPLEEEKREQTQQVESSMTRQVRWRKK